MIYDIVGPLLVLAAWAVAWNEHTKRVLTAHLAAGELASYKKVGSWYEARVVELEAENRNLAEQIVNSMGHPAVAMPPWPNDAGAEYAYDSTGLVRETLDPRDDG
jgi:hypothetical protein